MIYEEVAPELFQHFDWFYKNIIHFNFVHEWKVVSYNEVSILVLREMFKKWIKHEFFKKKYSKYKR